MSDKPNEEEFYKKLKIQLLETNTWPSEYLYKFIVLSKGSRIQKIEDLFDNLTLSILVLVDLMFFVEVV